MGFTKLDQGIVNSSIWSEPLATRVLWITMLAMSDEAGFVSTSVPGLIRASNISKEDFESGIKTLESPDPYSRTQDNEGRRIEKIEGGWVILNYPKYREREDKDFHREYMRVWRKNRKQQDCELTVNHGESRDVTVESPSASSSSSGIELNSPQENTNTKTDLPSREAKPKQVRLPDGFEEFWAAYPKRVAKGPAFKAYKAALLLATKDVILDGVRRYNAAITGKDPDWIAHPATWLNGQRWLDEVAVKKPFVWGEGTTT